ncbi:hypothetical protein BGZ83_007453 [Gryganskiella cystojenkinii]|nr:hypothetical protein BGZ83_007453 [Gryganskiella cystojenkinii]
MDGISLINVNERLLGLALDQNSHNNHNSLAGLDRSSAAAICSSLLQSKRLHGQQQPEEEDEDLKTLPILLASNTTNSTPLPAQFTTKDVSYFPLQPTIPSRSSSSSCHRRSPSKQIQQPSQQQHPYMKSSGTAYPVAVRSIHEKRGVESNVRLPPPSASDVSEVVLLPFAAMNANASSSSFAEGEILEIEMAADDDLDDGSWGHHQNHHRDGDHSSYPYITSAHMRQSRARCSSSTLFDEASRPPSEQSCYHNKNGSSDSQAALNGGFVNMASSKKHYHETTYDSTPSSRKTAIVFVDQEAAQNEYHGRTSKKNASHETMGTRSSQDTSLSTNSCAESPSWTTAVNNDNNHSNARLKIEPSTPVRPPPPASSRGNKSESNSNHVDLDQGGKTVNVNKSKNDSTTSSNKNNHSSKGSSSPLMAPSTPLTPIPGELLDKPTKNLMIFNKIPRQWPASQETLHHHFVTKGSNKTTVIKEFDPVTAERIDRVINKDKPLNRAAKEKLAAEQKEAELEARGFFEPARRWKGRDVYPRPANWVYCRRTKNNWLEKTKILVDSYKLFKGQVLGKGHHADVYKGVDLITGQDLAIKVIYKTVTRRFGFVNEDPMQEVKNRRLLNEAWFIDYLKDGPGICKMIRVVETATKFYFVMELAQSDLNSYSNGINMREEEIRHILKPIFECLKYAHAHDITHRDIKPENILLQTRKDWLRSSHDQSSNVTASKSEGKNKIPLHLTGSSSHHRRGSSRTHNNHNRSIHDDSSILSSTFANESSYMDMDTNDGRSSMDSATLYNFDHRFDASLADWGLAVEHDCNSGRKPVGTPLYAAPEVVRKMKRIRRREWINYRACDIWSLGVTMFVVASGIYPYHTHDALEAQSPPNWAALESSGMSREYIAFTQRLMNLTAELRPSAAEAAADPWLQ